MKTFMKSSKPRSSQAPNPVKTNQWGKLMVSFSLCTYESNRTLVVRTRRGDSSMKLVIQRVTRASVHVDGREISSIGQGGPVAVNGRFD